MPAGRPPKYDPEFHPKDFIRLSRQGKHMYQIAAEWDVCRDTIHDWKKNHPEFSDAFKKGQQYCEAWYMQLGQAGMVGMKDAQGKPVLVNTGLYVWLTKNKFKWADRIEEKQTVVEELSDNTDLDKLVERYIERKSKKTNSKE